MTWSVNRTHHFIIVFLIIFLLFFLIGVEYFNPPGMKAPWMGGVACGCNQGNFGPFSHNRATTLYAWDFDLHLGTPVLSATNGIVSFAGHNGWDGFGNHVRVRHSNGTYALYAHLDQLFVTPGQPIKQGQVIAYSGNTGNATGPHLHFSIMDKRNYSLPSRFADIGVPVEGGYYTSQNWQR